MSSNITLILISVVFLVFLISFVGAKSVLKEPVLIEDSEDSLVSPQAETTCNSCGDCSAKLDGSYSKVTLTQDIINHAGTCIIFGGNNIVFDCENHLIDGVTVTTGAGIFMNGKAGNTIQNCRIEDFSASDTSAAIYLISSSRSNTIKDNIIRYNKHGVWIDSSSNDNTIKNNLIRNNVKGIRLNGVSNTLIYQNNIFSNTIQASNTGTNFWDNGYFDGGNYWGGSCTDILINYDGAPGSDGICDYPYVIDADSQDDYPFVNQSGWELNRPPILNFTPDVEVNETEQVGISAAAQDPNSDPLTYYINDSRFTQNGNVFTWQTGYDDAGVHIVLITVSDGEFNDSQEVSITVNNVNRVPVLDLIGDKEVYEGGLLNFITSASDPDSDPLTYSVNNLPPGASFDPDTQEFNWTPTYEQAGVYSDVQFVVSDGDLIDFENITITVNNAFTVHHIVPFFATEVYSSAATAEMILNYLEVDPSLTQTQIHDYGLQYNLPENNPGELDPRGMDAVLGHFDPYDALLHIYDMYDNLLGGNPFEGYNFGIRSYNSDRITDYMRDIAHWMDYPVHLYYGSPQYADPDRVPPAVPVYGSYNNWVVVNGFASSEDPYPGTPDFDVYGFWLTDPNTGGLGVDRFITAEEAQTTYFLVINSADVYNKRFVQVAEPPPVESNAEVTIGIIKENQESEKLVNSMRSDFTASEGETFGISSTAEKSDSMEPLKIYEIEWRKIIPSYLLDDPLFADAFEGSREGKRVLVTRTNDGKNYYVITFEKNLNGEILTSAAIIVDADSGIFREASWVSEPEDYGWISKKEATDKALKYYLKRPRKGYKNVLIEEFYIKDITAEFVWEPGKITSSPFQPYWKITVNGKVFYVKNDGTVISA